MLALLPLFSTDTALAYFPSDFTNLLEGNFDDIRHIRRNRNTSYNPAPTGFRSQRGRTSPESLRVYSTQSYVRGVKVERVESRANWIGSRSNQIMDICREKFPENSLRCFSRNHRLTQMYDVPVTESSVR